MEMFQKGMSVGLFLLAVVTYFIGNCNAVAVMSVDIGSEWMKVAIVSPGVPMEIALNKESKRKTPVAIAFRDGDRTFGEDAQVVGVRYPQRHFAYILDLLGKSIDNPMVQLYKKRFPHYNIISDDERNTIAFRLDENTTYTPEELLAQILHKGKEFAEASAEQKINEAVITVPGFFNQAERKALLQAAELADLKVLQLINDYTAVALNYGIFRRKEINDSAQYIMFYDMGASSTTATIVSYQNVKTKERGYLETNPHVSVLGVGYDRTLGGLEMQVRLQNYLAKEFDALKKTKNSVFKNPRSMAKLFKEAGRVKNVLSANMDHFAQIEGLIDEQDYRMQVTREKLEEMCADLFERVANPIKVALETSGLTMDLISQVVLVGAGTRMPKVQDKLTEFVKTELAKNINTDEAAAMGAVYKAADLSQGFKVKKFVTKDAVLFPIQIVFDRTVEDRVKQVRRTLFAKMNAYPQKKIITFNKHTDDFEFKVNYAELEYLSEDEREALGNLNLSTISLSGISEALQKHLKEGVESKGIKAHFVMDESGILSLVNVELVFEKSGAAVEEEGTFSKLGSTISKLFTGSDDKDTTENVEEKPKDDAKPVHEEPEYSELKKESEENGNKTSNATVTEDKANNKTEKAGKTEKEKKPSVVTIKEPVQAKEIPLGPAVLSGDKYTASREKIQRLDKLDFEKARRETALNNLESFVIDAQQKLESEEYEVATTPEEKENILKSCAEISDWLYEDGLTATAEVYEEKLSELRKLTNDLYERVFEHKERPDVLKGMFSMINGSRIFLYNMQNLNVSIFTDVEIETLDKVINETQEYYDMVLQATAQTPLNEPVKYKVRDIANKMAILDREVKYLVNKAKIWKPKQESTGKSADNSTEQTAGAGDDTIKSNTTFTNNTQEEGSTEESSKNATTEELPEIIEEPMALPDAEESQSEAHKDDEESHQEL